MRRIAIVGGGPCEILLLEGIPGGPFDCFQDVCSPQQQLAQTRSPLGTYLPCEAERARHAELTDANGILAPLASAIANGFDHPPGLFPWWADETQHYLPTEGA
jgi:hypothetical protein